MAKAEVKIPASFYASVNKLTATMNQFAVQTQQMNRAMQIAAMPASTHYYQYSYSAMTRLQTVLNKFDTVLQAAIDKTVYMMGTLGRMFMRGFALLGGIVEFISGPVGWAVAGATFVFNAATMAAGFMASIGKWVWDKMVGLGDSMLQDYLAATGSLTTVGGLRAFRATFGALPGAEGAIQQTGTGQADVRSQQFLALKIMGLRRQDSADATVQLSLAAAEFMRIQQRGMELVQAEAIGLTTIFPPKYLIALRDASEKDIRQMAEKYYVDKKDLELTKKAIDGFLGFNLALAVAKVRIQNIIAEKLANPNSGFVQALGNLSKALEEFFKKFAQNPVKEEWVNTITGWVNSLTNWIESGEARKTIREFIHWVKNVVKQLLYAGQRLVQLGSVFTDAVITPARAEEVPASWRRAGAAGGEGLTFRPGISTSGGSGSAPMAPGATRMLGPSPRQPDMIRRGAHTTPPLGPKVPGQPRQGRTQASTPQDGSSRGSDRGAVTPGPGGRGGGGEAYPRMGELKAAAKAQLLREGLTEEQAETGANALVGQAIAESGLRSQFHDQGKTAGRAGGYVPSIYGADRRRGQAMVKWMTEHNLDPNDPRDQAIWMAHESQQYPSVRREMTREHPDPGAVSDVLTRDFEAPATRNSPGTLAERRRNAETVRRGTSKEALRDLNPATAQQGSTRYYPPPTPVELKFPKAEVPQIPGQPSVTVPSGAPTANQLAEQWGREYRTGRAPVGPTVARTLTPSKWSDTTVSQPGRPPSIIRQPTKPATVEELLKQPRQPEYKAEFKGGQWQFTEQPQRGPTVQAAEALKQQTIGGRQFSNPDANSAVDQATKTSGLSRPLVAAIANIESSGNPNAQTGSYKGVFQLSNGEFNRYGGQGSIFNANENGRVAGLKLKDEAGLLAKKLGRPVTPAEIYMAHQQGVEGAYQHLSNPDRKAWESMYATAEFQQRGERMARKAISGNIPSKTFQDRFGGDVENVTSGQFTQLWKERLEREPGMGGKTGEEAVAPPSSTVTAADPSKGLSYDYKSLIDTRPNLPDGRPKFAPPSKPDGIPPTASSSSSGTPQASSRPATGPVQLGPWPQDQSGRPDHYTGTLTTDWDQKQYDFSTGSTRDSRYPSAPYGTYQLNPEVTTGGAVFNRFNGMHMTSDTGIDKVWDPKIGRTRNDILLHQNVTSNQFESSLGCIVVPRGQEQALKKAIQDEVQRSGRPVYLVNSPNGVLLTHDPPSREVPEPSSAAKTEQGQPVVPPGTPGSSAASQQPTSNPPVPATTDGNKPRMYGFKGKAVSDQYPGGHTGAWDQESFERYARAKGYEPVTIDSLNPTTAAAQARADWEAHGKGQVGMYGFSLGNQPANILAGDPEFRKNLGVTTSVGPYYKQNLTNLMTVPGVNVYTDSSSKPGYGATGEGFHTDTRTMADHIAGMKRVADSVDPQGAQPQPQTQTSRPPSIDDSLQGRQQALDTLKGDLEDQQGLHITSTYRNTADPLSKKNPRSAHTQARAFDTRAQNTDEADERIPKIRDYLNSKGLQEGTDYTIGDEVRHPAAWATGPHIHTQFTPEGMRKLQQAYADPSAQPPNATTQQQTSVSSTGQSSQVRSWGIDYDERGVDKRWVEKAMKKAEEKQPGERTDKKPDESKDQNPGESSSKNKPEDKDSDQKQQPRKTPQEEDKKKDEVTVKNHGSPEGEQKHDNDNLPVKVDNHSDNDLKVSGVGHN